MNRPTVEVIIPTYRPGEQLIELVRRLEKQTCPPDSIHIMDTRSSVFPDNLSGESSKLRITRIEREAFNHGGTRALAADMSFADVLIYMTQDAMPANAGMIENLLKAFEKEKIGVAYARQLPAKNCNLTERYIRSFNYPRKSMIKSSEDIPKLGIKTYFCSNVCAAYRKDIYDSLGGFEEKTIFNEDMILAGKIIQSGYRIAYVADAEVIHSHNYNCRQQFHRNFDLAVSQAEHPEIFEGIRSEDEGIKMVKSTLLYLIKSHRAWMIIPFLFQSTAKYMGYRMGRNFRKLPRWLIKRCTMSPYYWEVP